MLNGCFNMVSTNRQVGMKCLSATKIITQARGNFKDLGLTNLLNKSKLLQVEAYSDHCEISAGSKTGSF